MKSQLPLAASLLIFCATVSGAPSVAVPPLSNSELVLGGFLNNAELSQFPAQIDIPPGWVAGLRAVAEEQLRTGREAGACLQLDRVEGTGTSRTALLAEYQSLIGNRSMLGEELFAKESARLRKAIADAASAQAAASYNWTVSRMQGGAQMSITVERNGVQCTGVNAGQVHSHPMIKNGKFLYHLPLPSDADLVGSVTRPVSVVVSGSKVCVSAKGRGQVNRSDAWKVLAGHTLDSMSYIDIDTPWEVGSDKAAALGELHSALYCGELGKTLNRVPPHTVVRDSKRAILGIKALLIMLQYKEHAEWDAIDFTFDPELSASFSAYLQRAAMSLGVKLPRLSPDSPIGDYYKVFAELVYAGQPERDRIALVVAGVSIPDTRIFPEEERAVFLCSTTKPQRCVVEAVGNSAKHPPIILAEYSFATQESLTVRRVGNGFMATRYTPKSGQRRDVQYQPVNGRWTMTGTGTLTFIDGSVFEGSFNDGLAYGVGTMRKDGKSTRVQVEPQK